MGDQDAQRRNSTELALQANESDKKEDERPQFKKQYSMDDRAGHALARTAQEELKELHRRRHKGFHNPIAMHSPDDPIPPFAQPIKPRIPGLHRTPSNVSINSQQSRKSSRAGSLFKRLAGMKMTSTGGPDAPEQDVGAGSAGIRRKMSTFIHGGGVGPGASSAPGVTNYSAEGKHSRHTLSMPSVVSSRRGSAASVITSGSNNSQQPRGATPQKSEMLESSDVSHTSPRSISRSASYFLLDTDLNNLSDITNIAPPGPAQPEQDKASTPTRKAQDLTKAIVTADSTAPHDVGHSKAQWTAPESWDVDDEIGKTLSLKSKRRHHRHHRHGANDSSLKLEHSNSDLHQKPAGKSEPTKSPIQPKPSEASISRQQSATPIMSRPMSPVSVASSTASKGRDPSETLSTLSDYEDDEDEISHLRADSMGSLRTNESNLLKHDEEYDRAGYQLEKYYNDFSDVDPHRRYAIRIFNVDDTFTTLSCTPNTTVQEMIPQIKRKFNVGQGNYQVSLKVAKMPKILRPTARPILIQRRLLLLNGYMKNDPLHIMGIEDLSFVFKFIFHPVATSHLTYEQEQKLSRGDFVHVDLRSMDLTTPPIIFYQYTADIESLDVSNNANIFLPLDFIESAIKLSSLRMVNIRASRFPSNITEAYKLVSLDLERNFIKKVPTTISNLNNLTILNLQCNELDKLPAGFVSLTNLQLLDISSNNFIKYPEVINYCVNLLQVDLSYNKIQSVPETVNQLTKLAKMNISNNRLINICDLSSMKNLRTLNLRHNRINSMRLNAPNLQNLFLTDNRMSVFNDDLCKLRTLEIHENPITSITHERDYLMNLTSLSLNKAKLVSLTSELLSKLPRLEKLELIENNLTQIPSEIENLTRLVYLSVARNKLESLPEEITELKNLKTLDVHSNNLSNLVKGMGKMELTYFNVSSNLLGNSLDIEDTFLERRGSNLAKSLLFLSMADNNLGDQFWTLFNMYHNLKTLNLSYNNFVDLSSLKLENLSELYLSGNKFITLPSDTVLRWKSLKVLMLNGNNLLTLPSELSQLTQLNVIDVGSNQLKYNISNYHYDWNWLNNRDLKYLNFSGNKRFEIKSTLDHESRKDFSDLTVLKEIRILGLMDVTLKTSKVPDESVNLRLRTTASMINGMKYGVADTLGQKDSVTSRDVTFERFRGKEDECLICLYDGKNESTSTGHKISKIIRDIYDKILRRQLEKFGDDDDGIRNALRFSFLQLNKEINGMLNSVDNDNQDVGFSSADLLSGSSATILFMKGKKLYTANIGDTMAILSKTNGDVVLLTKLHVPSKREEYERIRISGGYVNNDKLDGVSDVSRAVGFFDLLPHIHASPDISEFTFTSSDEMIIIATNKLWDYLDYETACDICRENKSKPMLAAEKLKDYAISYGCCDSVTILCLSLDKSASSGNNFTLNKHDLISRRSTFEDTTLRRLQPEIAPPTGNLAMVFTDIKNSTFLWELFPNAMRSAIKTHNDIMRRNLRIFGGYEVKTEGDAFMVAFPTPIAALVWCLSVQLKLLDAEWPEEITSIQGGCLITDNSGNKIYLGLSVRMGIHWGCPVPELDVVTQRMDYLGPVVNKASRVSGVADGGQITLSSDFCSEFNRIMAYHDRVKNGEPLKEVYGEALVGEILEKEIHLLENIGWVFEELGEQKLKGLETKEFITIAYPKSVAARHDFMSSETEANVIGDDILFQLRTISNRLESFMSLLNGGLIEKDGMNVLGGFVNFDSKTKQAVLQAVAENDRIDLLDHIITRVESIVAVLQIRQRMEGGLRLLKTSEGPEKSVYELVDQLLAEAGR